MRTNRLAALALAGLLAAAGPAADAAADPAAPWTPQGEAVQGAADSSAAPPLAPGGTYRDTIAVGRTRSYAVFLDAGSTAYLSAFAIPPPGSRVGFLDGITLTLATADGKRCDQYDAAFRAADAAAPIGGYVRRQPDGAVCRQAGEYFLYVKRDSAAGSSSSPWGLEIHFAVEPGLRDGASPGPVPGGAPPAEPAAPAAAAVPAAGAPSLDDATALPRSGAYRDHLMPGQSSFYRIYLTWGQQASVVVGFSRAAITQAGGFTASGARVDLYNPARGLVEDADTSYDGTPASAAVSTAPVAYANRFAADPQVNAVPLAGWYYLQVSLHPDVARYTTGGVDVTVRLDRSGTPTSGPPYRTGAAAAGLSAPPPAAVPQRPAALLRWAGYGALGLGALLLAAVAGWAAWTRRAPRH